MTLFLIGFASQILFAIFRTINVQYVAKDHLGGSLWSGTVVAILWVVTTNIGLTAFQGTFYGLFGYILGAALGIAVAMRHKKMIAWIKQFISGKQAIKYSFDSETNLHTVIIGLDMYQAYGIYTKKEAIEMAIRDRHLFRMACIDSVITK